MEDSTLHSLITPNLRIPTLTPSPISSPLTTQVPEPETIMPSSCIVAAVFWEIESRVRQAQLNQPDPRKGPCKAMFVPDSVRSDVLQWAHSTHLTCHPGINRTVAFLRQRFWWPTLEKDAWELISACSCLCPEQNLHQTYIWSALPSSHTQSPLITYSSGLCQWPSPIEW